MTNSPRIIFLLGPSGAGKSSLGKALADSASFLHIEIDQWPSDGIDLAGLRSEWNRFMADQPEAIVRELSRRAVAGNYKGLVASFPSLLRIPILLIERSRALGLSTIILYGGVPECLDAFARRETASRRNLAIDHWISNNSDAYMFYSRPEFAPYRVNAFADGLHRQPSDLVQEVLARISE